MTPLMASHPTRPFPLAKLHIYLSFLNREREPLLNLQHALFSTFVDPLLAPRKAHGVPRASAGLLSRQHTERLAVRVGVLLAATMVRKFAHIEEAPEERPKHR